MEKQVGYTRLATILGVGIAIFIALWFYAFPTDSSGTTCTVSEKRCALSIDAGEITLIFNRQPRAEEQVGFTLTIPQNTVIEDIALKGDSMYMGKVPVFIKANAGNKLEGWFMLGSCSQPTMRWRMIIRLKGRDDPLIVLFDAPTG